MLGMTTEEFAAYTAGLAELEMYYSETTLSFDENGVWIR